MGGMGALMAALLALSPRPFGDQQRIITWQVSAKAFMERPLVGIGPDCLLPYFALVRPKAFGHELAGDAHNDLLQVAATTGIVGLAAYLWLVVAGFSVIRGPALGALAAIFFNAKFSPVELEALILAAVIAGACDA